MNDQRGCSRRSRPTSADPLPIIRGSTGRHGLTADFFSVRFGIWAFVYLCIFAFVFVFVVFLYHHQLLVANDPINHDIFSTLLAIMIGGGIGANFETLLWNDIITIFQMVFHL